MEEISVMEMSKQIRKILRINQIELSRLIKCNNSVICLIEHGYEQPTINTSERIKQLYYKVTKSSYVANNSEELDKIRGIRAMRKKNSKKIEKIKNKIRVLKEKIRLLNGEEGREANGKHTDIKKRTRNNSKETKSYRPRKTKTNRG